MAISTATAGLSTAIKIAGATATTAVIGGGVGMYMGLGKEPPAKDGVTTADKRGSMRMALAGGAAGGVLGFALGHIPSSVPILGVLGKGSGAIAGVLAGAAALGSYGMAHAYFD